MLPDAPWTLPDGTDRLGPARARLLRRVARQVLNWPWALPPWLAHHYRAVRELLGDVYRRDPPRFLACLALPQVNGPILGGDLTRALPTLLLELGRRNVLPAEGIWWGGPVDLLVSPVLGLGRRYIPARPGMLFGPGWVETGTKETLPLAPTADEVSWGLRHGGWLCTMDTNPLAMVEAHPEKDGNAVSLGGHSAAAWVDTIDEARERIALVLPALAAEHRSLLATIVPVGAHAERSNSASYKEVIGQIYLSLHPNVVTMAEAIVHETQHNKINLLSWLDPLVENAGADFPSPVRPDPRPMWGVVLAVHAFLPVAALHRAWIDAGVPWADPARYREVCAMNHEGMEVIRAHAQPTELGRSVVDGLDRLERAFAADAG